VVSATAQRGRRFQFLQEIASGGFGSVYLAKMTSPEDTLHPQVVAVKLLHRRWTDNEEISSRMRDEARLLSRLRHEHIVEVLDFAVIDGRAAVIMEYLDAVDAKTVVESLRGSGKRLPTAAAFEIAAAVASALDAAYNRPTIGAGRPLRVIHRDIKPSNLMVDSRGSVKVLDFGIARADFDAREAKTAELAFGSLEYMPPERLFFEPESAASDVYSLGASIFELLAADKLGKAKLRPSEHDQFLTERLRELVHRYGSSDVSVTSEMIDLLRRMLAFDEIHRPAASEVASRMRVLAGWAGAPTLSEWAARDVPRILEAHRAQHQGGGTLAGQVLVETAVDPGWAGNDEEPLVATEVIPFNDPTEPFQSDPTDHSTMRDDTRWAEIRDAALMMDRPPAAPPAVAPQVPGNRPQNPLEWLGDDEELEGAPTVRIETDDRWPLLQSDELHAPQTYTDATLTDMGEVSTVMMSPPPPAPTWNSDPGSVPIVVVAGDDSSTATIAYAITAMMLFATSVLILVAVLMVGGLGVIVLVAPRPGGPPPAPAPVVRVEPPIEEPIPSPAAPVVGGVTFRSLMADTRRIMARCDGVSGVGTDEVALRGSAGASPAFAECTITAVDSERKRRTAVLSAVEARPYTCFAADDSSCE
jgi:serine/threonine protein kinase